MQGQKVPLVSETVHGGTRPVFRRNQDLIRRCNESPINAH